MSSGICGRCYDECETLFAANCDDRPERAEGALGMYHCTDCSAMLLAGIPHPDLCERCFSREHPQFD